MRWIPVKYPIVGTKDGEGVCIHLYNDGRDCLAVVVGQDGLPFSTRITELTFPKPAEYDYFGDDEIRKGGAPLLQLPDRDPERGLRG